MSNRGSESPAAVPLRFCTAPCDQPPDDKHYDRANDGTYQPGTFAGLVPSDRLPKESGNQCSNYSQRGRQDKAGWFIGSSWMKEPRDQPCHESYDDRPDNTHNALHSVHSTNETAGYPSPDIRGYAHFAPDGSVRSCG